MDGFKMKESMMKITPNSTIQHFKMTVRLSKIILKNHRVRDHAKVRLD